VTLEARVGEVLGVLGGRKSGKSTLIGLLEGRLAPQSGRVERYGPGLPPFGQVPFVDRRESVRNTIRFAGRIHDLDGDDLVRYVDAIAGLGAWLDGKLAVLPTVKRTALNYVLSYVLPRAAYLIDENFAPSSVPALRAPCLALIRERCQSAPVVFATRSPVVARQCCDRLGVIEEERLVVYPTVREAILRFRALEAER